MVVASFDFRRPSQIKFPSHTCKQRYTLTRFFEVKKIGNKLCELPEVNIHKTNLARCESAETHR